MSKHDNDLRITLLNIVNTANRIRMEHGDKCFTCDKYEVGSGFCEQWQDIVPIENRMEGCDHWVDWIPF